MLALFYLPGPEGQLPGTLPLLPAAWLLGLWGPSPVAVPRVRSRVPRGGELGIKQESCTLGRSPPAPYVTGL